MEERRRFLLENEKEAGRVEKVMSSEPRHEIINRLGDVYKIYRNAESIMLKDQRSLRKPLQ